MAIIQTINCPTCGQTKQESRPNNDYSNECRECKEEAMDRAEREWKAGREGLTVEERIRAVEHFMYHHGTHYKGPVMF